MSFGKKFQAIRKLGTVESFIGTVDNIITKLERFDIVSALDDLRVIRPVLLEVFKVADKYPKEIMKNYSETMFFKKEIAELSLELARLKNDRELAEFWKAELNSIEENLDFNVISPSIEELAD